jgi:hypothetical protein
MRKLLARLLALAGVATAFAMFRKRLPWHRWCRCNRERIEITAPAANVTVASPLSVSGVGQATQHNQLSVEVRDQMNAVVGSGPATVTGALGQRGPFSAVVSFPAQPAGSVGVVQVFDTSPATGAVTHLASVLVRF